MNTDTTDQDEIPQQVWQRVDEVIQRHRERPGALIPVLEEVQGITGYLPEPVLRRVAKGLDLPLARVYGVTTFYSFFTMRPRGRHPVRVCLGTACHVRGAKRNLDHLRRALGIEPGECTPDRQFGLEVVRCLGACGLAPVMTIDEDIQKQVKEARLDALLDAYREPVDTPEEDHDETSS